MAWQDFLKNNSDTLLQTGIGLIGGQTASQQATMGLQGFSSGRKQNRTMQFLQTSNPELAAAVQSGAIDAGDAIKLHYQQQMEQKKLDQANRLHQYTAVGKNIFDNTTAQFIQAPGSASTDLFDGTSVEGQALNGMVASGKLTKDQALEWAASKGITGPNGEALMVSPSSIGGGPSAQAPTLPQTAPNAAPSPEIVPVSPSTANPTATPNARTGVIQLTPAKETQDSYQSSSFAKRMIAADQVLEDPKAVEAGLSKTANTVDGIPLGLGSFITSNDYQKYKQAKTEFITAVLRKESGAVISDGDFKYAEQQYFPQPGEGPEIIAQKAAARQRAIDGMAAEAGPNFKAPPAQSGKGTEVIVNGKKAVVTKMSD